jgi:hypothetical protein
MRKQEVLTFQKIRIKPKIKKQYKDAEKKANRRTKLKLRERNYARTY